MSLIDPTERESTLPKMSCARLITWTFAKSWQCWKFSVWIWIPPIEILSKKQCNSPATRCWSTSTSVHSPRFGRSCVNCLLWKAALGWCLNWNLMQFCRKVIWRKFSRSTVSMLVVVGLNLKATLHSLQILGKIVRKVSQANCLSSGCAKMVVHSFSCLPLPEIMILN